MERTDEPDKLEVFAIAISALPLEALHTEQARIEHAAKHLERSNREIEQYITETDDAEEKEEMKEVIQENEDVMLDQRVRLEMLRSEISRRR
ncbi:hypothetical protein V1512DRAFT_72183 [Lipomyces arxii]|uniref:uncharacterized protein n=1 Tax=Lipomyces arxii TaxID=56418 RepID=UPI0034CDE143